MREMMREISKTGQNPNSIGYKFAYSNVVFNYHVVLIKSGIECSLDIYIKLSRDLWCKTKLQFLQTYCPNVKYNYNNNRPIAVTTVGAISMLSMQPERGTNLGQV